MKARAIIALKAEFPLWLLLKVANLAPSTFFYQQRHMADPDPQAALKMAIRRVFDAAQGRYGHRRILDQLRAEGWHVAKKTVHKLMRHLNLTCPVRRRRAYRSFRGEVGTCAPNRLNRQFTASAPNQKWVSDVTEFRVGSHKLYLAPVMDLFDRQIIAWAVGRSPSLELTNQALRDALATLPPAAAPLVHTDQGFQYQHASWRALLAAAGATPSMSRKGTCLDNAVIENFFGHLKEELVHHAAFQDVAALETALHEYIVWYNTTRISTTLQGMSPVQYRAHALTA